MTNPTTEALIQAADMALEYLEENPPEEVDDFTMADYNRVRHTLRFAILKAGGVPHGVR